MSNFDPNAIIRGAQLTVVGAYRALQNPALFTSEHYRQAALAVAAGIAIRIIVEIPILGVQGLLWFLGLFTDMSSVSWGDDIIHGLEFLNHGVLQVPFFLMTFMRHASPSLDNMFMESLKWVDQTYVQKHKSEDPKTLRAMYYPNMKLYPTYGDVANPSGIPRKSPKEAAIATLQRYGRKTATSLVILGLSYIPYVGRFVLPAASFYAFNKAVGTPPAVVIFGSGIFLPKRYLIYFLQSFFASRSLMRDLLDPYFQRIRYTPAQKKTWFKDREGVLFGFGVGFFVFLKIPMLGVLIYGIAEASTAYLLTKITDPPPAPDQWKDYCERESHWKNKKDFLKLPYDKMDAYNVITDLKSPLVTKLSSEPKGRQFS